MMEFILSLLLWVGSLLVLVLVGEWRDHMHPAPKLRKVVETVALGYVLVSLLAVDVTLTALIVTSID